MIKKITHHNQLLAIIVTRGFSEEGVHFFTPSEFSQQLAFIKHPTGTIIQSHTHNPLPRDVLVTQEVLFIKSGKLRVDFYDDQSIYVKSCILAEGDVILLASGGHGFQVLDQIEMIEVKQGPYPGKNDKTSFVGVTTEHIILDDEI